MPANRPDSAAVDLTRLQARSDLLLALYMHAARDVEALQTDRDRRLAELIDTQDKLAQALGEIRRLTEIEQRHAALLASTSWRVTAPIRTLGRLMKRAP
jgi:hypothetical protein